MKKTTLLCLLAATTLMVACKGKKKEATTEATTSTETVATPPPPPAAPALMCFENRVGKDVTTLSFEVKGDSVIGEHNWTPFEKDGAYGTIKGTLGKDSVLNVRYDYTIEGSEQAEMKQFKWSGNAILEWEGELTESKDKAGKLLLIPKNNKGKFKILYKKSECKS